MSSTVVSLCLCLSVSVSVSLSLSVAFSVPPTLICPMLPLSSAPVPRRVHRAAVQAVQGQRERGRSERKGRRGEALPSGVTQGLGKGRGTAANTAANTFIQPGCLLLLLDHLKRGTLPTASHLPVATSSSGSTAGTRGSEPSLVFSLKQLPSERLSRFHLASLMFATVGTGERGGRRPGAFQGRRGDASR